MGMMGGFSGDNGPATSAKLSAPTGVAVTADGGFLIGEFGNDVVRRVSPGGTITTVAGTPMMAGFSGDGGPVSAAKLDSPWAVAVTPDGGFLIAEKNSDVVRRVSPGGTITTVAGMGTMSGFSGDGGPATAAKLASPFGVAVTPEGGFLIADASNDVIRFVDADLRGPAIGPTGASGTTGTPGLTGGPGLAGPGGVEGSRGPQGAQGAGGIPGRDATVVCHVGRARLTRKADEARRRRSVRITCRVTLASARVGDTISARLSRAGTVYARATAHLGVGSSTLTLRARRAVTPGPYTLILVTVGQGQHQRTSQPVRVV
jgi:hypothetical protein